MLINRPLCHVCASENHDKFFTLDHRRISKCSLCSYLWATSYDAKAVEAAYAQDYYPSADHPKIEQWNTDNAAVWKGLCDSVGQSHNTVTSLLDIGSGTGGFVLEYNRQYPEVDISIIESAGPALEYLRQQLPTAKVPVEDAMHLADVTESYDVVTLFQVLEHVEKPAEFCAAIYDKLKPGGCLVLTVPNRYSYKVFLQGRRESFCYGNTTHLQFFSRSTLEQLLKNSGFVSVKRLVEMGGAQMTGFGQELQYVLRRLAFSTELRFVAYKE